MLKQTHKQSRSHVLTCPKRFAIHAHPLGGLDRGISSALPLLSSPSLHIYLIVCLFSPPGSGLPFPGKEVGREEGACMGLKAHHFAAMKEQ